MDELAFEFLDSAQLEQVINKKHVWIADGRHNASVCIVTSFVRILFGLWWEQLNQHFCGTCTGGGGKEKKEVREKSVAGAAHTIILGKNTKTTKY